MCQRRFFVMKLAKIFLPIMATVLLADCNMNVPTEDEGDGDSGSGDHLDYTKAEAENKLYELGKTSGYEIELEVTDSDGEVDTYKFGQKGEILWGFDTDEDGVSGSAIKKDEKYYFFYDYESDDNKFVYSTGYPISMSEDYIASFSMGWSMWLYYGNSITSDMKKGADTTVAGRSCYTYSYSYSYLTVSAKYSVAIDKELGITLKFDLEGRSETESGSAHFVAKSFKTGNQVSAPVLEGPTAEQIAELDELYAQLENAD